MSETTPPPPTGGGAKYGLIGILLILLAIGVYCGTQPDDPEPVADPIVETPTRPTQFEPEIEIPDEEEDAGPPDTGFDAGEEEATMSTMMSTMRRVPRNCEGNLDVAALQQVVARQRPQVRACYERALKQNNILQGTVNVRMIIGNDGSVDEVRVGGSLRDNEVFGCVRRLARSWRFPRPTGGSCAQVNAPFNLTPRP